MNKIRPDYYINYNYEPRKVINDWGLNFNLGSVIKYISRAGNKEGESKKQDLEKAKQYIDFELEKLNEESNNLPHMFDGQEGEYLDLNWEDLKWTNWKKEIEKEIVEDDKKHYLKLKVQIYKNIGYLYYWNGYGKTSYGLSSKLESSYMRTKFKRAEYPEIAKDLEVDNLLDWFYEEEVINES